MKPQTDPRTNQRTAGLTLFETVMATSVLLGFLLSAAGGLVAITSERRSIRARSDVLQAAVGLLEEVRQTAPGQIVNTFDGVTRSVVGLQGAQQDGSVLSVSVDSSNPQLLEVVVNASWQDGARTEQLELSTRTFSSYGQSTP